MKKLRLQIEELAIDSFPTVGEESGRATVRAYDSYWFTAGVYTCVNCSRSCPDAPGPEAEGGA